MFRNHLTSPARPWVVRLVTGGRQRRRQQGFSRRRQQQLSRRWQQQRGERARIRRSPARSLARQNLTLCTKPKICLGPGNWRPLLDERGSRKCLYVSMAMSPSLVKAHQINPSAKQQLRQKCFQLDEEMKATTMTSELAVGENGHEGTECDVLTESL